MSRASPSGCNHLPTHGSRQVHFVGIGGIGMSGLAQILLKQGKQVSGSDLHSSPLTDKLSQAGARVAIGHNAENVKGADLVVVSDAIPAENSEVVWAKQQGIPVISRSQLLGEMMQGYRGIAVTGTHGKTTTAAMIAFILERNGSDPMMAIGGELPVLGGNARFGKGEFFVVEACEAYNSFLDLQPEVAVVTNLEAEHLDFHKTKERLQENFARFLEKVLPSGAVVLNLDQPELEALAEQVDRRVIGFSLESSTARRLEPEFRADGIEMEGTEARFHLHRQDRDWGEIEIRVPGLHNVANALAAAATAGYLEVEFSVIRNALVEFPGVRRRFQVVGEMDGVPVIDDYAHHPTEIKATLEAARQLSSGQVIAIFQPHLFTRTRDFLDEFAQSFDEADVVLITEIYPAREKPIAGVTAERIAQLAKARHPQKVIRYLTPKEMIAQQVRELAQPGDLVLVMGAGDIDSVARELVR